MHSDVNPAMRVLVLVAHPDDAEFFAGGLLWQHRQQNSTIQIISVTDGRSGHQSQSSESLSLRRRAEAHAAGQVLGAEYVTWNFPDGYLTASLEVREKIIESIRQFQPDLVLTHRTCDYHPDHRAVAQAVQDASYLVTVPKVAPHVPALPIDPVVAYLPDLFTRPTPIRTDIVLDATSAIPTIVQMLACHVSQVFEWLPYNQRIQNLVPASAEERTAWLETWFLDLCADRQRFWKSEFGPTPRLIEAFEISEYAGRLDPLQAAQLFPGCLLAAPP